MIFLLLGAATGEAWGDVGDLLTALSQDAVSFNGGANEPLMDSPDCARALYSLLSGRGDARCR